MIFYSPTLYVPGISLFAVAKKLNISYDAAKMRMKRAKIKMIHTFRRVYVDGYEFKKYLDRIK